MKDYKPLNPCSLRQLFIDLFDIFFDQLIDLWFLRKVGICGVGNLLIFRPLCYVLKLLVNESGNMWVVLSKDDRLSDVWAEFEFILDVLR